MKTRLEYLRDSNNKLTHLDSMYFTANEFVWVPPLNSGVNLDVFINGKKVQQQFVVNKIMTEYDKYPGEEQKCIISVVVKQIGLDPMGDDE